VKNSSDTKVNAAPIEDINVDESDNEKPVQQQPAPKTVAPRKVLPVIKAAASPPDSSQPLF